MTPFAVSVAEATELIAREDPDLAFVVLDGDDEHGLALISETVEFASRPGAGDRARGREPARRSRARPTWGSPGYVDSWAPEDVQGAIEVAMRRHREEQRLHEKVEQLESALERRAVIERAKGILMERHAARRARGVRAAARPRALERPARASTSRRPCSTGTRCCPVAKSAARRARQPALTGRRRASACSRWTTRATPPASVTSSAPGSQSHGSVSGWIQASRRPAATQASSSVPGPAWRSRPARSSSAWARLADAGRDEPVLAEEGGDVGLVERARGAQADRLAVERRALRRGRRRSSSPSGS